MFFPELFQTFVTSLVDYQAGLSVNYVHSNELPFLLQLFVIAFCILSDVFLQFSYHLTAKAHNTQSAAAYRSLSQIKQSLSSFSALLFSLLKTGYFLYLGNLYHF